MPGSNILGSCAAWTDTFPEIETVTLTANGVWACQDKDPKPFPENVQDPQFDTSGSLGGTFTWTRMSKQNHPSNIAPAERIFIGQVGCCTPTLQVYHGTVPDEVNGASYTCLYVDQNGDTLNDDIYTGDVNGGFSITTRNNPDTDAPELKISVQVCSEDLSCLGRCFLPCVIGDTGWIPQTSLPGTHHITDAETEDGGGDEYAETFTWAGEAFITFG
jgi:hypothetical protein